MGERIVKIVLSERITFVAERVQDLTGEQVMLLKDERLYHGRGIGSMRVFLRLVELKQVGENIEIGSCRFRFRLHWARRF